MSFGRPREAVGRAGASRGPLAHGLRLLALVLLCAVALQLYFALRVAAMNVVDPQSTSFQRSEAWRLWRRDGRLAWQQRWVERARLSANLQRAVLASEDAGFTAHGGIEWEAIDKAWSRNARAEARRAQRAATAGRPAKVVGGSTVTQQLAKNLFLSGERTVLRKSQEAAIAFMLEACLSKARILEIYLNNVEWGEGVFGAEAAARRYFGTGADALTPTAAARLAVMLPAPKRFEQRPASTYVLGRAATVAARMGGVALP